MPSEIIQVRANVARVLSPGKLRNFPRMKLWERGRPGSSDGLSPLDKEASVSKQHVQGQGERGGKRPENLQDTAHKQVAEC